MSTTANASRRSELSRRIELARIHIQRAALALDDDTYRDLLQRITGERSASSLGSAGRQAVIAELTRLGAPGAPSRADSARRHKTPNTLDSSAYLQKIGALLAAGKKPWGYAHAMARRMFGRERLEFCDSPQLRKIVAALAIDARRVKS